MDLNSASSVVLQVLTQATSQNTAVLKPAEEQLKQWETQPGFYSVLLNIFTNHTLDVNVRWLAVLYFKNGIDRYWRRVAPHALSEEEKSTLRAGLIANFNEPVNQIATQISVLIAKVARLDCPRQWPELIPTLVECVKLQDDLHQHRALLTFYHVTKTLASKRLAADRKLFYDILFKAKLPNQPFSQTFRNRLLRKLTVHGFVEPHRNIEVMGFLHAVFERLKQFLECTPALADWVADFTSNAKLGQKPWRKQEEGEKEGRRRGRSIEADHVCRDRLEKTIILFTKVLLDFLDQHPFSFTSLIQRSLEFAVSYAFTEAGEGVVFERFIVQCMNLIKMIVKNYAYKPSKNVEDSSPETLEAHKIKASFFTYPTLTEICRRLVTQYFLLTEEELTMWEEDPEGFTVEETGGDSWKYSIRPCTEVLFIDIFHEYNQTLTPVLLEMVHTLQGNCPTNVDDTQTLLIKDADLLEAIDLIVLVSKYSLQNSVFLNCFLPVDDFEFRTDQFLPYLESMFTLLFQLLQEVRECDTKMHVLHVLSCVIERVNVQIRPYVGCLVQYLPLLWKQSEEHNMLRCAILTTLIHLVQGLGADSKNLYPFLLPVIQLSTDVSKPPHVYLLEDGLELWLVTLENSSCLTSELLRIFQNMSALLELSSENLRTCFKIINGYLFLSPSEFLQVYAAELCKSFCEILKDITIEGQVQVLKILNTLDKKAYENLNVDTKATVTLWTELPTTAASQKHYEEYSSGKLEKAASVFTAQIPAQKIRVNLTIEENSVSPPEAVSISFKTSLVCTEEVEKLNHAFDILLTFFILACGVIIVLMYKIIQFRQKLKAQKNPDSGIEYYSFYQAGSYTITDPIQPIPPNLLGSQELDHVQLSKSSAFESQAQLVVLNHFLFFSSIIQDKFCGIINISVEGLHDVMTEDTETRTFKDCMLVTTSEEPKVTEEEEPPTEQDTRKKLLALKDPVHSVSLQQFVYEKLKAQQELLGEQGFQALMETVDTEIVTQLQDFLQGF
ncbi:hypothetical protein JD844_008581 [Phrynosoma platyrhinos]|uniref:Importin N-terminal domain-containing protein n=1 Tax=Phrynosoma platyrhinos TaxID=52577 RepID=A0ABQ7TEW2_PHRPL|nr:hypothetical protein JD844_008581 [Phrynosoma platyrhinos]